MGKNVHSFFWLIPWCVLSFFGCAKETVEIGREDPEREIKKCVALSQKKHYEKAVECLEIFKSRFPQTPQGQEAELKIADNYFGQKQYLLAADTYQAFIKLYPLNPQVDYALFRAGLSYLYEAPKAIDRDQQYLYKAVEQFKLALRFAPQSTYREALVQELRKAESRVAKRIFYVGHFYYRTGEYISAVPRFKELSETFPESELTPKGLYYLTKANLELGRFENAREAVENLVQKFPKNPWTKRAQNRYLNTLQKKK